METLSISEVVELPYTIQFSDVSSDDFVSYYLSNREAIEQILQQTGAVKFKGVTIDSKETFQNLVNAISDRFLSYIDGTSPRTKLVGNVYTSTEYDKTEKITMHNELSYSAKWPNKIFFSCLQPALSGGETLLADSRKVLARMDPWIVSEVERRGILYIRNLHGGNGMGLSWQKAFETSDKAQLEKYCRDYGILLEWKDDDAVRLIQKSKGIITHRKTGEKVWFNQIDQFHPYQLGEDVYNGMMAVYESADDFPTYVKFGDGTVIEEAIIKAVLKTTDEVTLAPVWERNELLIVDNELVSHGRNPFTGDRTVLVAMSE